MRSRERVSVNCFIHLSVDRKRFFSSDNPELWTFFCNKSRLAGSNNQSTLLTSLDQWLLQKQNRASSRRLAECQRKGHKILCFDRFRPDASCWWRSYLHIGLEQADIEEKTPAQKPCKLVVVCSFHFSQWVVTLKARRHRTRHTPRSLMYPVVYVCLIDKRKEFKEHSEMSA